MLVLRVKSSTPEVAGEVISEVIKFTKTSQSDLDYKKSILDRAFTGQLTEIVRMGVSPEYQGLLGSHVWLAPDEGAAIKKWREKGDLAFIPEELPIILPLILESADKAKALIESKRWDGTFITSESPHQDTSPEVFHIQAGEELELIDLHVKENSVSKVFIDTETTGLDP